MKRKHRRNKERCRRNRTCRRGRIRTGEIQARGAAEGKRRKILDKEEEQRKEAEKETSKNEKEKE